MLTHPTLDLLHELGLHGMAKGFKQIEANPEAASLTHAEWLALLLDHEVTLRRQKRFEARSKQARLRQTACPEDVDYRRPRGLDRAAGAGAGGHRQGRAAGQHRIQLAGAL